MTTRSLLCAKHGLKHQDIFQEFFVKFIVRNSQEVLYIMMSETTLAEKPNLKSHDLLEEFLVRKITINSLGVSHKI